MAQRKKSKSLTTASGYGGLLSGISELLDAARRTAARRVNSILTATYWEIGGRIVEHELSGQHRADYGEQIIDQLADDLTRKHGRGFSRSNVFQMRGFFLAWEIAQTQSGQWEARAKFGENSIVQTVSGQSAALIGPSSSQAPVSFLPSEPTDVFPMSWSHYVRLLSVEKPHARAFYEVEAIRGGWSVRQLDRQISTQLFERTSHSKRQSALLAKAQVPQPEDAVSKHGRVLASFCSIGVPVKPMNEAFGTVGRPPGDTHGDHRVDDSMQHRRKTTRAERLVSVEDVALMTTV